MTLANKITILRIALIPFFALAAFFSQHSPVYIVAAMVLFVCIALTDFLDGYFARKRNERTRLGTALDPIADKLTMVTAMILLGSSRWPEFSRLMTVTVVVVIGSDVLILAGAAIVKAWFKKNALFPPTWSGKFSTGLQLALIPFALFFQVLRVAIPETSGLEGLRVALLVMQWWVIVWITIAFVGYVRVGFRMVRADYEQ